MRTAVILFNLGGPESLAAVKPFLFRLFSDPAIIPLSAPLRYLLAWRISRKRTAHTQSVYKQIGGKSPLLKNTMEQADALEKMLQEHGEYRVFVSMRYSLPFAEDVAKQVSQYDPDKIVLLPLYPQYSTTTTASSLRAWRKTTLSIPTTTIENFHLNPKYIEAHVDMLRQSLEKAGPEPRVLFSAHGVTKRTIEKGDPYEIQINQTVAEIVRKLDIPSLDWGVCYQSRARKTPWLEPDTESQIILAGEQGKAIVIVPISFVSEHMETLVELDIDYKELAEKSGVTTYIRVPALGVHPIFIQALTQLVQFS